MHASDVKNESYLVPISRFVLRHSTDMRKVSKMKYRPSSQHIYSLDSKKAYGLLPKGFATSLWIKKIQTRWFRCLCCCMMQRNALKLLLWPTSLANRQDSLQSKHVSLRASFVAFPLIKESWAGSSHWCSVVLIYAERSHPLGRWVPH